jgi:hypothetical protein
MAAVLLGFQRIQTLDLQLHLERGA